jgi:hypothetical protein
VSPGARKAAPGRKTRPAAKARRSPSRPTSKPSAELSRVAEQDISRAEALAALYRPLQEAAEEDLKTTKSRRDLLEAAHQSSASLDELYEGIRSERTSAEEGDLLLRGRQEDFFERHDAQLDTADLAEALRDMQEGGE